MNQNKQGKNARRVGEGVRHVWNRKQEAGNGLARPTEAPRFQLPTNRSTGIRVFAGYQLWLGSEIYNSSIETDLMSCSLKLTQNHEKK